MAQQYSAQQVDQLIQTLTLDLQKYLAAKQIEDYALVGIHSGGAWLAEHLQKTLQASETGSLDISFYRDDFTRKGLNPKVQPTTVPFAVEGKHIVLVDDVLMTGRTIRAALNELFDYGRPASVTLAVLFDIGHRQLPIAPDICGESMALAPHQRVELSGPEPLTAEIIEATAK